MNVYYENSDKTKKIMFDGKKYGIADLDLFEFELSYDTEDDKITEFKEKVETHEIQVNVSDTSDTKWQQSYDEMMAAFLGDVRKKKPGTLYVNECYLSCYIYAAKPSEAFFDNGWQTVDLKIVTDHPVWVYEQKISVQPIASDTKAASDAKTYPYGYEYGYPIGQTAVRLTVDHYADSDFRMIIYGPAADINITIADHPYIVHYQVEAGEYLTIDSKERQSADRRIFLTKNNGEKVNVFNYRDSTYSALQKIPAGELTIDYSRLYGIDLTLYLERSEPKWI